MQRCVWQKVYIRPGFLPSRVAERMLAGRMCLIKSLFAAVIENIAPFDYTTCSWVLSVCLRSWRKTRPITGYIGAGSAHFCRRTNWRVTVIGHVAWSGVSDYMVRCCRGSNPELSSSESCPTTNIHVTVAWRKCEMFCSAACTLRLQDWHVYELVK